MRHARRPIVRSVALASIFVLGFSGCRQDVDLKQVRALSQLVASAEPSYEELAGDLYQSCLRESAWHNTGNFSLRIVSQRPQTSQLGPGGGAGVTDEERKALAIAMRLHNGGLPVVDPFSDNAVCEPYKGSVKRWKAVSALLTGYFDQLGAAAADDSKAGYGFTALSGAIGKSADLSAADQKTFASLATDIATAIFDARRRTLTADEATKAQAAVDYLVQQLSAVAADYLSQLSNEQGDIDSFFKRNFVAQSVGLQTLETIQYRIDWKNAIDDVNKRRSAESAYVSSLAKLAAGHDAIVKAASTNDYAGVYAAASATETVFKPDLAALQKALGDKEK